MQTGILISRWMSEEWSCREKKDGSIKNSYVLSDAAKEYIVTRVEH